MPVVLGVTCAPAAAQSVTFNRGYLNFGGVAGLSGTRDTSSYYSGQLRGESYNRQTLADRYR